MAVVVLMGARSVPLSAQPPSPNASGFRVTLALAPGVMWGQFRGTDPHLYQDYEGARPGPSVASLLAFDWKQFGGASEIGLSRLRLGGKWATAFHVRGGARYQPRLRLAGFSPGLQIGFFGLGLFTAMQPSETPMELGPGVQTCCAGDQPNLAEEWFKGYSTALWLERPIARGFAFGSRAGLDFGQLTSMRRGRTSYTGMGKPKWVGRHLSVGMQYTIRKP